MRPSHEGPIVSGVRSATGNTRAPVDKPVGFLNGIKNETLSRKPTTCASIQAPAAVSIWQRWPVELAPHRFEQQARGADQPARGRGHRHVAEFEVAER